jgi:hypothetical protein
MMKKAFLLFFAMLLVSHAGCAKTLRYSDEEIKDFPPAVQEKIKSNEISVGMTMLHVRYSWGAPDSVRILAPLEDGKERVEWIYKKAPFFKTRLIFTDNKLTEIMSSEPGVVK